MREYKKYHNGRERINRYLSAPEIKTQLRYKLNSGLKRSTPPVNIIELYGCYKIEIPVPGFRNGDFLIKANDRLLTISAVNNQLSKPMDGYGPFNMDINLPENTDTDFGTAECKDGVLYIYLSKTNSKNINLQSEIVVY